MKIFNCIKHNYKGVGIPCPDCKNLSKSISLYTGEEIIKAQEEYIKYLHKYIDGIAVYLHIHGMGPKDEQVQKAEKLRKEIEDLKKIRKNEQTEK